MTATRIDRQTLLTATRIDQLEKLGGAGRAEARKERGSSGDVVLTEEDIFFDKDCLTEDEVLRLRGPWV